MRAIAPAVDTEGRYPEAAVAALRTSGLLGLTLPTDLGGLRAGPVEFAETARQLATDCGSTAMIYLMHVAAAMPLAAHPPSGQPDLLVSMASGDRLGTLAFSEKGSRSHTSGLPCRRPAATTRQIRLSAEKSWVTSSGWADTYVVNTMSIAGGPGASDLYAVDAAAEGIKVSAPWQGLGLRGNASSPMLFDTTVTTGDRLGDEGSGFATMMGVVLPWFNLGNASVTLGLARAALDAAVRHVLGARLEHLGSSLADLPTIRHRIGRAGTVLAANEAYVRATAVSIVDPDDSTMLKVLGSRAAANDTALQVTDEAMRVCGGSGTTVMVPVEGPDDVDVVKPLVPGHRQRGPRGVRRRGRALLGTAVRPRRHPPGRSAAGSPAVEEYLGYRRRTHLLAAAFPCA